MERDDSEWRHGQHLRVLPPSANWYCAKVCDWGSSDAFGLLFAYGAKSSVVVYKVTSKTGQHESGEEQPSDGVKVSFFAQLVRGKRDRRVTAVQFVTDPAGSLRLVCGGEEGSVQIWDVATLAMIEQQRKHKAEVTAVTVSGALDANFVVAGDRQGRISTWERDAGKVSIFMPISGDGIHSMSISPHDKSVVAVGYRSGVLCIVNVTQGTIQHRLGGHDQEVQCVAWKSTPWIQSDEDDEGGPRNQRGIWLASSSRDKTIKVWNLTSIPALDQVLRLPTGKQGMSFSQTKQLWLPVAWNHFDGEAVASLEKHSLWSGSFDGSLLLWEWSTAKEGDSAKKAKSNRRTPCKPIVVKGGHSRMLFNIAMVPFNRSALAETKAVSMLTVSLDREMRLWKAELNSKSRDTAAATCVETLIGLGGHAYSVAYNATTNAVAAGVGDQTIRLWRLGAQTIDSELAMSDYDCDLLWKGLQSKVTCVRWHPFQHSTLAFGTEDGTIGLYDIQTKKYNRFRSSHDHEVQQLEWRVMQLKVENEQSAGDGDTSFLESVMQLEAAQTRGQSLEDALVVQESQPGKKGERDELKVLLWSRDTSGQVLESNADAVDQKSRKAMIDCAACSWNEHCQLVALGRTNGSIEVVSLEGNAEGSSVAAYRFHEHLEEITSLAWSKDGAAGLLASGGQDGKIFVYSCAKVSADDGPADVIHSGRVLGSLVGHSGKITDLRWCPDIVNGLVASSSADGTIQVWNTKFMRREAHFGHHVGRVLSLDWVSLHTLVTGGEDQTLRVWDYRAQQKDPSARQKQRIKVKQPQQVATILSSQLGNNASVQNDEAEVNELPVSASTDKDIRASNKSKPKKKKTQIFHQETKLTQTEIASACCNVFSAEQANAEKLNEAGCNLLANRNRAAIKDFFVSEAKSYRDEGEWESVANVLLLQGNISEALRVVAKEGVLSASWLAYAPMAGMDVWREMTNLYAHQLDAQGDKKDSSIAKVRSAINCLVSGDAYTEALALIRSRLGPYDPVLSDTLWKYADFLSKRGRHGEAALALLNIGSAKAKAQAVRSLVNTGDLLSIKAALDVLVVEIKPSPTAAHDRNDAAELSFPASFFISIAGRALAKSEFDIAETAGQALQSQLVTGSSSKPSASHRLVRCLLGVVKTIDEYRLCHGFLGETIDETQAGLVDQMLPVDAPVSVREFFGVLTNSRPSEVNNVADGIYGRVSFLACGHAAENHEGKLGRQWLVNRADRFWSRVLNIFRCSGYWFDADGTANVQEAQDLLLETSCFGDIEKSVTAVSQESDAFIGTTLKVAQRLLRFVIEVISSSFVGALEHMRELLLLVQSDGMQGGCFTPSDSGGTSRSRSSDLDIDVMTLLCPCGFVSPKELPQCGELADEQLDTLALWSSVLISQCTIVLATFVSPSNPASAGQTAHILDVVLRLLRTSFLSDDTSSPLSPGLMDNGNQAQLEALLNEVLVLAYQLPDGIPSPRKKDEESTDPCNDGQTIVVEVQDLDQDQDDKSFHGRKKSIMNDANDVRSCLEWSGE